MKKKLPLRWVLLAVGLFFFVNPNYAVIDVLPDFIGALLLVIATLHFAEIDERAKSAQKAFVILSFTDAGKMLSLLLLTGAEDTAWRLTFTFCFGVGEGCLFAYGMCKLFDAVTYKAMRLNCEELCRGFTALKGMAVLIAILKNLLPIFPELTLLSTDYGDVITGIAGGEEVADFIYKALMILNITVVLIYGLGWWIYTFRYIRTVGKNTAFLEALERQYDEEVGAKHEVLTYRALKTVGILLTVALLFAVPLRIDGTDFLPDFLAGALFVAAALRMKKLYAMESLKILISGGIYTALALAEWVYEYIFNQSVLVDYNEGYYESVSTLLLRHPARLYSYYGLIAVGVLKHLAFIVVFFFLCVLFLRITAEHTGAPYDLSGTLGEKKDKEIKKKLTVFTKVLFAVSVVSAASGIFTRVFRMFTENPVVQYLEPVCGVVLLGIFLWFHAKLGEGIDNKYYFDD